MERQTNIIGFAAYVWRAKTTFLPATLAKMLNHRRENHEYSGKVN